MATNKRTYPNTYFAWYNDDRRVAILELDTISTSGEKTKEKYDTYQQKQQLIEAIEAFHASKTPVPDEVLYLNILPYLLHDPQSQIVNDQGLSTLKEAAIRTCRQLEIQLNEHNHNYRQYLEASGNH